ncbi:MAG: DEAD/DEAH box helicase [Bacteroidota bacterium]
MTFKELGIVEPILKALRAAGYERPTPIQEQSIPILLEGRDLLGCAQTGTGKTAAFAIPILQHLYLNREASRGMRKIRALVVSPTRELAIQIAHSFTAYSKFLRIRNTVIFGGVKQGAQVEALQKGIDVLVATPGRLLDLIDQGYISLRDIDFFVLDEADHMLDMGFIHSIKRIIKHLPEKRQSLFFSATLPPNIMELSRKILGRPERVSVRPEQATAEKVEQAVYFVRKKMKAKLLVHLLKSQSFESTLVFSRTKYGADRIVRLLKKKNIKAEAIHGNKSQNARQRALGNFKRGETKVLVATDIAARGIDVSGLSLVINYNLPNVPETYVHRIGRTGRANAAGIAYSFCDTEEEAYLKSIQKLIRQSIPVIPEHPYQDDGMEDSPPPLRPPRPKPQNRRPPRPKKQNAKEESKDGTEEKPSNRKKRRRPNWRKRR